MAKLYEMARCANMFAFLLLQFAEARSLHRASKQVAATGQLLCNGKPVLNAVASLVAYTSGHAYVLNDSPTDTFGHYSLEATFFSDGEPLKEFKLRFVHECFDSVSLLDENWAARLLRKGIRLANADTKTGIANVVREESVPSEYIYDGKEPPKVYEFSIDLNN